MWSECRKFSEFRSWTDDLTVDCRILLELDPSSDPVWIFFDVQHASIKKVLEKSHARAAAKFQGEQQLHILTVAC